jgi:hypothetical protein
MIVSVSLEQAPSNTIKTGLLVRKINITTSIYLVTALREKHGTDVSSVVLYNLSIDTECYYPLKEFWDIFELINSEVTIKSTHL